MNRAGRAIHIHFVMTSKIIYSAMALDSPLGIQSHSQVPEKFSLEGQKRGKLGMLSFSMAQGNSSERARRSRNP
jgi:hypothetical protein